MSCEEPESPLLSVHSWYATEVTQKTETGEIGYRTLWYYLNPADITPHGIDPEKMNQAMLNFAKEWENTKPLDSSQEDVVPDKIEEMTQAFEELTKNFSKITQEVVSETVEEMTQALEGLTESFPEVIEEVDTEASVYDALVHFFKTDKWPFQTLPEQTILRLAFQGQNGKWDCYAKARVAQQQCVFYSICPIKASDSQRQPISEFLTRANNGMVIGNFEFDFDDGEIRYKTSIDVEGDNLSSALVKNLVYTNVLTMNQYLPGIIAILENNVSPVDAIAQIEN